MSEISVYVLKPFPFSRNGIKEEQAEAGSTIPLPNHLFSALNREGYIRRADIGDGHFSLRPSGEDENAEVKAGFTEIVEVSVAPVTEVGAAPASIVVPAASNRVADTIRHVVNAAKTITGVTKPAPQPASATADLTADESAALADGTWKEWRFFKQRSVAAKLSDKPIKDGADANTAIEAYIASKAL